MWFPVSPYPKGAELKRARKAQAVCEDCPVRTECLTFALRTRQHGIWGGLSGRAEQRRRGLQEACLKRAFASGPEAPGAR